MVNLVFLIDGKSGHKEAFNTPVPQYKVEHRFRITNIKLTDANGKSVRLGSVKAGNTYTVTGDPLKELDFISEMESFLDSMDECFATSYLLKVYASKKMESVVTAETAAYQELESMKAARRASTGSKKK